MKPNFLGIFTRHIKYLKKKKTQNYFTINLQNIVGIKKLYIENYHNIL